jgi:hypothetical protein
VQFAPAVPLNCGVEAGLRSQRRLVSGEGRTHASTRKKRGDDDFVTSSFCSDREGLVQFARRWKLPLAAPPCTDTHGPPRRSTARH